MHHGDRFELLDRHDLLRPTRSHSGNGVLAEPGTDLAHRVPLRRVKRFGHVGV